VLSFEPSARATAAVVASIPAAALSGPTPSPGYDVATLLDHLDGLAQGLLATARKENPPAGTLEPADGTRVRGDWRRRIGTQLLEMARAWDEPGARDGQTVAGTVPLAARDAALFALDELVVHGWELARSTGLPYAPDPAAVRACADFLAVVPRAPELFGEVEPVAVDAPVLDRLIGLSGRDPRWRP